MRKEVDSKVLAIFCADLHLSLTPPPYRSAEPGWFAAMARPLKELTDLQKKHNCPIFCAGDIFDKWNAPAELINFAMTHLPYMHCIPGQHDLPEHDLGQIERSAYWTLVKASVIHHMDHCISFPVQPYILLTAFPFGTEVISCPKKKGIEEIALTHQYNWVPGASYKGDVPKDHQVDSDRKEFKGYDLVVSGDNHIPFEWTGTPHFINCGGFMNRKSDDAWHPVVWLLRSDDIVVAHRLDTSKDIYLDTVTAEKMEEQLDFDLTNMIDGLGKLGTDLIDVRQAFLRAFRREPGRRMKMLLKAMEE